MYIHWTHHYLPRTFGILSFVFNPIFIYLVVSDKQTKIGNYKYLLVFFAIFDIIYSGVEMLVPVAIHGTGSAFVIYLTEGIFFEDMRTGQFAVSVRCGFIALSYGILAIHFIYRYFLLFNPSLSNTILHPTRLGSLFLFFIAHGIAWSTVCELTLYRDDEASRYIFVNFMRVYNKNSYKMPMLVAIYSEVSTPLAFRAWAGILILTGISIYAISLYMILGTKIMRKLKTDNRKLSAITKRLHKQLMKALIVQTFIPIVISFAPCLAAWYAPVFHIDLGMWNNYIGVIALSAFPFLDPLAIIFLLPNYRNKLFGIVKSGSIFAAIQSDHVSSVKPVVRSYVVS